MKPVSYERLPKTLGQHLKKRRLEQGLRQHDVQTRFKLDVETYANWEKDRCHPAMKHWPQIIAFLGYDPNPVPATLGEQLLSYRRKHGMSRKTLASLLDADDATVWRWEFGGRLPTDAQHRSALELLLGN